ncbi:unnamed protein product, partial [Nesidiocoris tenuis]
QDIRRVQGSFHKFRVKLTVTAWEDGGTTVTDKTDSRPDSHFTGFPEVKS